MSHQEPQFQQAQEFQYYTGYRPSIDNEVPFSEQGQPILETQMPGGPYKSGSVHAGNFSERLGSRHGTALAVLCYAGLWITGFLFLLFGARDRFIRFHAIQSLIFFGGVNIIYIVLLYIITNNLPFFFGFAIFALVLLNIVALVAWFVGVIGALQGRYAKLPFVGDFAERAVNNGPLK